MNHPYKVLLAAAALAACQVPAHAFTFTLGDDIKGGFDSTVTMGTGIRTTSPDCNLVNANPGGAGAPAGCLSPTTSGYGDQGNLNYKKGRPFTTYLKGTHELLLKAPSDVTFMARGTWLRDISAQHTTGYTSSTTPNGVELQDGLSQDARRDLRFKGRVLDLWIGKSFDLGDQRASIRVGNQVLSWGESLFLPGGINSINALDIMRLSQPGTQLKEAVLPAPMITFSAGLGAGVNVQAYIQSRWNANYFPPTGSYWSTANGLGRGDTAYGNAVTRPKDSGQGGISLRYQPSETQINLGLYAMSYQDKAPQFSFNAKGTGAPGWVYPENRALYGISANFPVGDVAVGTELSYRPRDAVSLNGNSAFVAGGSAPFFGGDGWVDEKKFQWHGTALFSLTPSNSRPVLDFLGADTGTLMAEAVVVAYPSLKQEYANGAVSAGGWGWGTEYDANALPVAKGTKTSSGINFDFSWVYDGTLVPGWQVVPEVFYFQALHGRTPNAAAPFMQGAKSVNLILSFIQNPATWQASINYAAFFGGKNAFDQPLRDRDFVGFTLSRNF